MPDNVTINDKAAFQATIATITELNNGLTDKLSAAGDIASAVTAAASRGVVSGGDTTSAGTSGKVAAAYTGTVGALNGAVDSLAAQAKSASTAVTTAISDLTSLLVGLTQIDNNGAHDVKNS